MTGISLDSKVSAVKDQVSCTLGGEVVILSMKNGTYYSLNPVGVRIWNLIHDPIGVHEIHNTIVNEFNAEPERCEEDLLAILTDMEKEGLIEVEG